MRPPAEPSRKVEDTKNMLRDGRPTPLLLRLLLAALLLTAPARAPAQSGRTTTPPSASSPASEPTTTPTPTPEPTPDLDRVTLLQSRGFESFVRDLNERGKAGYRLERSAAYGGRGAGQTFAAVLRLDPGHRYEYDWLSSPNPDLLDTRLNTLAKRGFNYADSYAVTLCGEEDDSEAGDDPALRSLEAFKFLKGNVYLLERRDGGGGAQGREYLFYTGKLGPGKNPKETIQAALDRARPGFRPLKMLFSKSGWLDFRVSLLLERDLNEAEPPKAEYHLVKEVTGFEKEVNKRAAEGFRFEAGGRVGSVKFVLMRRRAGDPAAYTFLDVGKHEKEFDKTVAAGNVYEGMMGGAKGCEDQGEARPKLVFASAGARREYKILTLLEGKTGGLSPSALADLRRLDAEGFRARDLFHAHGLNLILER